MLIQNSHSRFARMTLVIPLMLATVIGFAPSAFGMATLFTVKPDNKLQRLKSNTPAVIDATVNITGLQVGETLIGIDFRPETGGLYGVGTTGRLYVIDFATGVAAQIGTGVFAQPLLGTSFGTDFNPLIDRLRLVSDADQNLRVNPNSGAIAGVDTNLAYVAGDPSAAFDPAIVAIAYRVHDVGGVTSTTVYGIDSFANTLVRIGGLAGTPSPNLGQLSTIGPLGVDTLDFAGFDIGPEDSAFAALDIGGQTRLFTINLTTGAATLVGTIGDGTPIRGLAVAPVGRFEFSQDIFNVSEGAAFATITVQRLGGSFGSATVQYLANDGTAVDPDDYDSVLDTLTFGAGETSKTFNVVINEDNIDEPTQTVNLSLLNPTGGATLGARKTATLRILDNDGGGGGFPICGIGLFTMAPLTLLGLVAMRRRSK